MTKHIKTVAVLSILIPGPRHIKVVKNGTSCSSLDTQTYGVEPVSG